jgi:serine/threonine protein kinase/tetratricopeptide (TPR) repeat protein
MAIYKKGDEPVPGYRLIDRLGRGSFGEVWKAVGHGIEVALKIIDLGGNQQGLKEFRAVRLVKRIRHPNLSPLLGVWLKDERGNVLGDSDDLDSINIKDRGGELIIAMALGDKNLQKRLDECRKEGKQAIPPDELLRYMESAANGIDYLNQPSKDSGASHDPIQHCDIKPQNILIQGGMAQVCDFGLAKVLDDDLRRTRMSEAEGTFAYMAPELICAGDNDKPKPSKTTDQYSLAISYYELRTGSLPFKDTNFFFVARIHVEGKLDFSQVPTAEQAVLRRATDLDPHKRYPTTLDMVKELRRAIEGRSGTQTSGKPRSNSALELLQRGVEIVPGYKLLRPIGRGGYGEVWEAVAPGGKHVALKIVTDLGNLGRQEFKALELIKSVQHVFLMELHAYWVLDAGGQIIPDEVRSQPEAPIATMLIIATQLADKSLKHRFQECLEASGKKTGIPARELLRYVSQAAEALDYLNTPQHMVDGRLVSIQHRDVKPDNILLVSGAAKVADFGLAKILESNSATIHERSVGLTLPYAAPEVFFDRVMNTSDQYSLAVTYFHLRTGKLPFPDSASRVEIMRIHTEGRLDLTFLPGRERTVVQKATAVEPTDRYVTCTEMAEDLVRAFDEEARGPSLSAPSTPVVPEPVKSGRPPKPSTDPKKSVPPPPAPTEGPRTDPGHFSGKSHAPRVASPAATLRPGDFPFAGEPAARLETQAPSAAPSAAGQAGEGLPSVLPAQEEKNEPGLSKSFWEFDASQGTIGSIEFSTDSGTDVKPADADDRLQHTEIPGIAERLPADRSGEPVRFVQKYESGRPSAGNQGQLWRSVPSAPTASVARELPATAARLPLQEDSIAEEHIAAPEPAPAEAESAGPGWRTIKESPHKQRQSRTAVRLVGVAAIIAVLIGIAIPIVSRSNRVPPPEPEISPSVPGRIAGIEKADVPPVNPAPKNEIPREAEPKPQEIVPPPPVAMWLAEGNNYLKSYDSERDAAAMARFLDLAKGSFEKTRKETQQTDRPTFAKASLGLARVYARSGDMRGVASVLKNEIGHELDVLGDKSDKANAAALKALRDRVTPGRSLEWLAGIESPRDMGLWERREMSSLVQTREAMTFLSDTQNLAQATSIIRTILAFAPSNREAQAQREQIDVLTLFEKRKSEAAEKGSRLLSAPSVPTRVVPLCEAYIAWGTDQKDPVVRKGVIETIQRLREKQKDLQAKAPDFNVRVNPSYHKLLEAEIEYGIPRVRPSELQAYCKEVKDDPNVGKALACLIEGRLETADDPKKELTALRTELQDEARLKQAGTYGLYVQGRAADADERSEEAVTLFNKAELLQLTSKADDWRTPERRQLAANVYLRVSGQKEKGPQLAEAYDLLDRALKILPEAPLDSRLHLAELAILKTPADAKRAKEIIASLGTDLRKTLTEDQHYARALVVRARALVLQEELPEAVRDCEEIVTFYNDKKPSTLSPQVLLADLLNPAIAAAQKWKEQNAGDRQRGEILGHCYDCKALLVARNLSNADLLAQRDFPSLLREAEETQKLAAAAYPANSVERARALVGQAYIRFSYYRPVDVETVKQLGEDAIHAASGFSGGYFVRGVAEHFRAAMRLSEKETVRAIEQNVAEDLDKAIKLGETENPRPYFINWYYSYRSAASVVLVNELYADAFRDASGAKKEKCRARLRQAAEDAIKALDPEDPSQRWHARLQQGNALEDLAWHFEPPATKAKRYDEALHAFEESIKESNSLRPEPITAYGRVCYKRYEDGDTNPAYLAKAIQYLSRACKAAQGKKDTSQEAEDYCWLGKAYLEQRQFAECENAISNCIRIRDGQWLAEASSVIKTELDKATRLPREASERAFLLTRAVRKHCDELKAAVPARRLECDKEILDSYLVDAGLHTAEIALDDYRKAKDFLDQELSNPPSDRGECAELLVRRSSIVLAGHDRDGASEYFKSALAQSIDDADEAYDRVKTDQRLRSLQALALYLGGLARHHQLVTAGASKPEEWKAVLGKFEQAVDVDIHNPQVAVWHLWAAVAALNLEGDTYSKKAYDHLKSVENDPKVKGKPVWDMARKYLYEQSERLSKFREN